MTKSVATATSRSAWQRYGVAIGAVGLATLVTWLLRPYIGETILIFYFGAVIYVGWWGGLGAGLLATLSSVLVADLLFIEPAGGIAPLRAYDLIPLAIFTVFSVMASVLSERLISAREVERQHALEATTLAGQLQDQASEMELQSIELEQQAEETKAAHNRLEQIMESMSDAFVVANHEWRVTYINPSAEEIIGKDPEAGRNSTLWEMLPEIVGTPAEQTLRQVKEQLQAQDFEYYHDQLGRWLAVRGYPTDDGISVYFRDVTSLKQAGIVQARLAAIVASTRDSVIGTDLQGTIVSWNRGAEQLYGYSAQEAIGQPITFISPPDRIPEVEQVYEGVRRGETIELHETVRRTKAGRSIDVSVTISPIREGETVVGVSKIDRDITQRKRDERRQRILLDATRRLASTRDEREALDLLAELLVPETGSVCLIHMIKEGRLHPVHGHHTDPTNAHLVEQLLSAEPVPIESDAPVSEAARSGKTRLVSPLTAVRKPNDLSDYPSLQLLCLPGTNSVVIVPLTVRGSVIGTFMQASPQALPYPEGELQFLEEVGRRAAIAIDNARAYQAEHAAREEAERANQSKFAFLTRMSHELRTPLNAIAGYAQLLELGIHGPINERQGEAISGIQRNEQHLLGLINDVLDYAKLEGGHVRFALREFSVTEVLADIQTLIEPLMQKKKLHYKFGPCVGDVRTRADPEKFEQIVLNLLSNAVKFTAEGGEIRVRCEYQGDHAVTEVIDTGEGIAADKLKEIFEPFIQADMQYTRTKEGTGLGLSISRDLARAMGGDITVTSEVGRGSTFRVWLPKA